jgi:hypothetical protein
VINVAKKEDVGPLLFGGDGAVRLNRSIIKYEGNSFVDCHCNSSNEFFFNGP